MSADAPSAIEAALARDENAPNYFDPADTDNIEDAATRGIAVGIFGVLLFLAYLAFFLIRCVMCCCCGKGLCARNKTPTTTKVIAVNVILCAIPVMLIWIGGGLLAWKGNGVGDSLDQLVGTVLEQVGMLRDEVGNITSNVRDALQNEADSVDLSALDDAQTQLSNAYTDIEDIQESADDYTDIIEIIIYVLGAAAFALGIWGLITLLARRSFFMTVFMVAACIIGPCLWILGGVGLATHEYANDACDMMRRHANGQLNPWVLDEARCQELSNAYEEFSPTFEDANTEVENANQEIEEGNNLISTAQQFPPAILQAAGVPPSTVDNLDTIPPICVPFEESSGTWVANTTTNGCTPLERARIRSAYGDLVCEEDIPADAGIDNSAFQECVLNGQPLKQEQYDELIEAARKYEIIREELPTIRFLSDCRFLDRAFRAVLRQDCPDIKDDLWKMMTGSIIAAVGVMAASLYFCVCFRNIRHRRYRPGKEGPERTSTSYERSSSSGELAAKSPRGGVV